MGHFPMPVFIDLELLMYLRLYMLGGGVSTEKGNANSN